MLNVQPNNLSNVLTVEFSNKISALPKSTALPWIVFTANILLSVRQKIDNFFLKSGFYTACMVVTPILVQKL